ncbi:RNA polymerase sigma factor [Streptomyces flaveolus]|uniref:RNA polymerase sigma factor n=1 Tax=Streptomyces flaveolus TaxID=67297 RepID=UPI0036FC6E9A
MPEIDQDGGLTLGETYTRYHGELLGYTRRALREAGVPEAYIDEEDVVHNAFAKAYRDPARVTQPRAYIYAVIRHEVLEHAARASRACSHTHAEPPLPARDCSEVAVARHDVHKALSDLPQQQRAAVWATKGLEWSQAEYAEDLGKGPGTVATHVSRAVAALKVALAVTAALTGVLFCGAGIVTIKRYSAASQPGRPHPSLESLLEPFALPFACVAFAVGLAVAIGVLKAISFLRRWLWSRRQHRAAQTPPQPMTTSGPPACQGCGKKGVPHRKLTDEEERWFHQQPTIDTFDHLPTMCTTPGCRHVSYVLGEADMGAGIDLPELPDTKTPQGPDVQGSR